MSDLYKLDTWKELFGSWKLLIPTTVIVFTLWLMPGIWVKDSAVVALRDQYRGHLGFAAIALAIISSFKGIYEVKNLVRWFQKRRRDRAQENARRKKTFRKVSLLGQAERDLLQSCADKNDPHLEFSKDDPQFKAIYRLGILNILEFDHDLPTLKCRVQDWVLAGLRERHDK